MPSKPSKPSKLTPAQYRDLLTYATNRTTDLSDGSLVVLRNLHALGYIATASADPINGWIEATLSDAGRAALAPVRDYLARLVAVGTHTVAPSEHALARALTDADLARFSPYHRILTPTTFGSRCIDEKILR